MPLFDLSEYPGRHHLHPSIEKIISVVSESHSWKWILCLHLEGIRALSTSSPHMVKTANISSRLTPAIPHTHAFMYIYGCIQVETKFPAANSQLDQ